MTAAREQLAHEHSEQQLATIVPGTYVVIGGRYGWKSFMLHADGRVDFVDARDGHVSTWWSRQSPEGQAWLMAMEKWLAAGELRKVDR